MWLEQPPAPNAPPKAATALEMAIYEFEKKCDAYHATQYSPSLSNESPQERDKRLREWREAREHLEQERRRINTLASIEDGLVKYRMEFNALTSSQRLERMRKEKHHPTKVLARHLLAEGEPKPSLQHVAHHLIPGKGRCKQKNLLAARIKLHLSGIRINDPRNGVWIPNLKTHKNHWATPEAPTHKSIHGVNYEHWISVQFLPIPPGPTFVAKLRDVKMKIKSGTYPVKIESPKDPLWSGK
ncbi:AHH domain-containing protein [Microbulbifer thermotolerans]|uniref:AHH domain-containing protein n=1 Tax=Microbulbifer thermotolerans TaxID=252514 RepID=UPI002673C496|nr:AHH domain-containing protein [Microbulbifer thermotolerans]WKT59942.1 AHH domain-containing protein [Microbulbifer thermotolerans]